MRLYDVPRERAQALVLGLGLAILVAIAPFAAGLLGAGVLYVVFDPIHRRLVQHLPAKPAAAVVLTMATTLVLVPGILLFLLIVDGAPGILERLQDSTLLTRLAALRIAGLGVGAPVAGASEALLSWLSRRAIAFFGGAVRSTLNLTVALFGLYYLLVAPATAWERFKEYLPFSSASAEALRARFRSVTEAMLLGIALTALLQGSVVGFGFWLVGLPDAPFWGVVTAFASVLPVLGSATVWLPGAFILAADGRLGAALALVALGAGIASSIDNVMRPLVYRRVSHIHPMTTVVGAFAGVALFGLIGVLVGPLAISYFFELLSIYRQEHGAAQRAIPSPPSGEEPGATKGSGESRVRPVSVDVRSAGRPYPEGQRDVTPAR